jgi:hypothetical protein
MRLAAVRDMREARVPAGPEEAAAFETDVLAGFVLARAAAGVVATGAPRPDPHGLRHGHQTWMDEDRIADVLKSERMGHEVPGMRGIYSHVSDAMRAELTAALQERWAVSLRDRARLAQRSIVPVLDALLVEQGGSPNKIRSQIAPKIGHGSGQLRPRNKK